MEAILTYRNLGQKALEKKVRIQRILEVKAKNDIVNAKFEKDHTKVLNSAKADMEKEFSALR